jgi:hypothetical protein
MPPQPNNHTQRYESYLKINCNDVWQCFHVLILYISLIICVSYTKQYTMRNYNILHTIHYIYSLLTYIETVWYDGILLYEIGCKKYTFENFKVNSTQLNFNLSRRMGAMLRKCT